MSFVNYHSKEINCKIVYCGPGLSGKTTNIQEIYKKTSPEKRADLVTLEEQNERTLFFDFLPLDYGEIRGFKTRFHLYSIPGQNFYEESRRLILRGVDGLVFVADSQIERMDENLQSLSELKNNLEHIGADISKTPFVFQWNKRDLANISTIEELNENLNSWGHASIEAIANRGEGVFETLKSISKQVVFNIKGGLNNEQSNYAKE